MKKISNVLPYFVIIVAIINHDLFKTTTYADKLYDITKFGASPNGIVNSTQALIDAWTKVCRGRDRDSTEIATIYVPKGRYLVYPLKFSGKRCSNLGGIKMVIDGTFVAPLDYWALGVSENWFGFDRVSNVSIFGGSFDATGKSLWDCKAFGTNSCPEGATTLSFKNSKNITVNGVLSLNSQMFHIVINRCRNIQLQGVRIIAPDQSPNTDGIHVQLSSNIVITNSSIQTGDDCISIGPGTKDLWIERLACGPGHGISIGSLAKDMDEEGVQNVTIKSVVFTNSTNGFRIKSWARPSNGFVKGVQFLNAIMQNVQNPIVIDQNYCPRNEHCPGLVSGVKISDILCRDIYGTSTTRVAIKMECSKTNPCTEIRLENINLSYLDRSAKSSCSNANGIVFGFVQPNGCL